MATKEVSFFGYTLMISGLEEQAPGRYEQADRVARDLHSGLHYEVKLKERDVALLEAGIVRAQRLLEVDSFYEDGSRGAGTRGWLVNEINTMPGFTPISMYPKMWQAAGLDYPSLLDELVQLALARHERDRRHSRTDH